MLSRVGLASSGRRRGLWLSGLRLGFGRRGVRVGWGRLLGGGRGRMCRGLAWRR
jgi:hypothetical protein